MPSANHNANGRLSWQPDGSELESLGSDLTSLSSSIFNYKYENGRTYHAYRSGNYVRLPSLAFHVSPIIHAFLSRDQSC